jgi:hypothetical protein
MCIRSEVVRNAGVLSQWPAWQSAHFGLSCTVQTLQNSASELVNQLAAKLMLGELLREIVQRWGVYEFVDHWQQGEFHHDTVLRVPHGRGELSGAYLVVATNCNGGVKEVLCLDALPTRGGLWRGRCPANVEFEGELPSILARRVTDHWFDPCVLLGPGARSEYRADCRVRQPGGGWMPKKDALTAKSLASRSSK